MDVYLIAKRDGYMKNNFGRVVQQIFLLVLLAFASAGCNRLDTAGNYELSSGQTIPGSLLVPSGNVSLGQGSLVKGSVWMLCCDLIVRGEVDGNVLLVSGDIQVDPQATIRGAITDLAGNVSQLGNPMNVGPSDRAAVREPKPSQGRLVQSQPT